MDGPVFDAMLKTALEEAIRLDAEEIPEKTVRPSARHRRRMRRMLDDPWGYLMDGGAEKNRKRPIRYLAAIAAAAVLTGTAAGYAFSGGGLFREMFDTSPWADAYGDAADTEQLLDMGGELETAVVEANGLRFEMLDAVSDGQLAMVSVRLTVLEKFDQMRISRRGLDFDETDIVAQNGEEMGFYSISTSYGPSNDLKRNQYSLIFSINDLGLTEGGTYEIHLKDIIDEKRKPILSGEWVLAFTLQPAKVLELRPECVCTMNGADWNLEQLVVSPLALTADFRLVNGTWDRKWDFLDRISVNLQNGQEIDGSIGASGSDSHISMTMEFHMPMDVSQIKSVTVGGEEIPLNP